MKINRRMIICFFISMEISVVALAGYWDDNSYVIWTSILLIYAILAYYTIKNSDVMIVFGGFLVTFFTFLIGKYGFQVINGKLDPILENAFFVKESIYVYISLISLFIGYSIFKRRRKLTEGIESNDALERYVKSTRTVGIYARYGFLICIVFTIIVNLDIASRTVGRIYSLVSIASRMPFVIQKIAQMSGMFYWIFLSTLPDSKKVKIPTILFVFNAALTLLSGVRGTVIRDVMSVGLYYWFRQKNRNKLNDRTVWISRGMKFAAVIIIPLIVVFLGLFAYVRHGEGLYFNGLFNGLQLFFDQQGGSVDVIGRAIYCQNNNLLPKSNISYTFGPVINLVREGMVGKIFGFQVFTADGQTVALATQGNNLGATVTYIMSEGYYNIGGGYGTCYIAEVVTDFGLIGIIVFHLFLGWLLNSINYFMSTKWWMNAISLLIIRDIIYIPRDFAFSFISSILSATNLLPLLCLMFVSISIQRRKSGVKLLT